MTYENYLGFSREVLLEKMGQILLEKRLTHCLGVEKAAREIIGSGISRLDRSL